VDALPVNDATDIKQFARQIEHMNEVVEKPRKTSCQMPDMLIPGKLKKIIPQSIIEIVPSKLQVFSK